MPFPLSLVATHDHIAHALRHLNAATRQLEAIDHEVFSAAAFESRITAYGSHCSRKALLERITADLEQLAETGALFDSKRADRAVPLRCAERSADMEPRPTAGLPLQPHGNCA